MTHPALVRSLSRVHSHVDIVLTFLGEIRIADFAHMCFDRSVLLHMSGKILIRLDSFVADLAVELRKLVVLLVDVGAQG